VTTPPLALPLPGGGRAYRDPLSGRLVPSVTTVLRLLAKPELEAWKLHQVAEAAVCHYGHLGHLVASVGPEEATYRLVQVPERVAGEAAQRGTLVHAYAEARAKAKEPPPLPGELAGYCAAFESFVAKHRPRFLGAEVTVWDDMWLYAGTLDAWALVEQEGRLVVVDYKTTSRVHPEAHLQLAALARAPEVIEPNGRRVPAPKVEGGLVVRLRADGSYELVEVDTRARGRPWQAFRALAEAWWALQGGSLMNEALPAPAIKEGV
jgi:hypothetical protein